MLSRPDGQSHSPVPVQCRFVGFEDVKIQAHKRQQDFFLFLKILLGIARRNARLLREYH